MQPKAKENTGNGRLTIVIAALPFELLPLTTILSSKRTNEEHDATWGFLGKEPLLATCSGVGSEACIAKLNSLWNDYFPREFNVTQPEIRTIFWGTCGGLDPKLTIGDVVLANTCTCWDIPSGSDKKVTTTALGVTCTYPSSQKISTTKKENTFMLHFGTILTWHEPVLDEKERIELFRHTGASCIDMETGAGAAWCEQHNIPWLAMKAISDVDESFVDLRLKGISIRNATMLLRDMVIKSNEGHQY